MDDSQTPLPQPLDELILPDGKRILPDGTIIDPATQMAEEIVSSRNAVALITKMKRNLGDLPDIPSNMNPICVVLTYTSIGLSDADIATALSTTEDNIRKLKDLDSYQMLEKMFDERIFEDEQRNARHIISKYSSRAAQKMVDLVDAKSGDLALAASRDVLRIGGVDKSQQNTGMTSFKIIMVDGDEVKKQSIEIKIG